MPSFPRLAERFGKRYSWKVMLNPRTNINERFHPRIGDLCSGSRDTYHKQWKKVLHDRAREKPTRYSKKNKNFTFNPIYVTNAMCKPTSLSLTERIKNTLFKIRTPQLSEVLSFHKVLGSGIEGIVRSAYIKHDANITRWEDLTNIKHDSNEFAVKTVEKRNINGLFIQRNREKEVLETIPSHKHPHITSYFYTFESPLRFHIVTEYNKGGDLFNFLQSQDFQPLEEKEAANLMLQLFSAVQFVHDAGYVHLDLKLENVMLKNLDTPIIDSKMSIIDFGHAAKVPSQIFRALSRAVGSPSYASPEVVLENKYCVGSDAWSLGIIMYILLQGFLPFPHLQHKKWKEFSPNDYGNFDREIQENNPFFYEGDWEDISAEAKDLCQLLLQVNPLDRISIPNAMQHPWFENNKYKLNFV